MLNFNVTEAQPVGAQAHVCAGMFRTALAMDSKNYYFFQIQEFNTTHSQRSLQEVLKETLVPESSFLYTREVRIIVFPYSLVNWSHL